MIFGKVEGKPLHGFRIRGNFVFVVRSAGPGGLRYCDPKTGVLVVLAPPGMSYHQTAREAVARLEAEKFRGRGKN